MPARILVVDDVEVNRRLLEAKLSVEYYEIITAENGAEALERAKAEQPDLILLDIMMPEMDGFEVCQRLKADPALTHIPVVMVTALSEQSDKIRGLEVGADDFLTKPVDDWALRSRIRSLLRLKMASDELLRRRQTGAQLGVVDDSLLVREVTGARVLVIDDSPSKGKIRDTLEAQGYEVQLAEDVAAGLELGTKRSFDLVLVRLRLSSGDPLRLCAQLRTSDGSRSVPILVIADAEDRERIEKAIEIGINDYFTSPVDPSELIARVRTQVRRKKYNDKLKADYEHGLVAALKDGLTGVYNRRYLDTHLDSQLKDQASSGREITVVMLDIDHFKQINDTHGHMAGDDVLRGLVPVVRESVRDFDTVARYGGEEFVVVLSGDGLDVGQKVAERLRGAVASTPFVSGDTSLEVTVSIGVAAGRPGEHATDLLSRADAALYRAKEAGRNRVVADDGQAEPLAATSSSVL